MLNLFGCVTHSFGGETRLFLFPSNEDRRGSAFRLYRTSRAERGRARRWEVGGKEQKQRRRWGQKERPDQKKKRTRRGAWTKADGGLCACLCAGGRKWGGWRYTAVSVQTFRLKWERSSRLCLQEDDLYQWGDSVGLWMTVCVGGCARGRRGGCRTTAHCCFHADSTYTLRGVWPKCVSVTIRALTAGVYGQKQRDLFNWCMFVSVSTFFSHVTPTFLSPEEAIHTRAIDASGLCCFSV